MFEILTIGASDTQFCPLFKITSLAIAKAREIIILKEIFNLMVWIKSSIPSHSK